jgi:hypothetical protein
MAVCAVGREAASEADGGAAGGAAGGAGSEGGVRARGRSKGDGRMVGRRALMNVAAASASRPPRIHLHRCTGRTCRQATRRHAIRPRTRRTRWGPRRWARTAKTRDRPQSTHSSDRPPTGHRPPQSQNPPMSARSVHYVVKRFRSVSRSAHTRVPRRTAATLRADLAVLILHFAPLWRAPARWSRSPPGARSRDSPTGRVCGVIFSSHFFGALDDRPSVALRVFSTLAGVHGERRWQRLIRQVGARRTVVAAFL